MQINKIQKNTPNFQAQLNIIGPYKFDKQTLLKLNSIAKDIGNKKDVLTIQSYNEILSPYGGQCFAPSFSVLPIDLKYAKGNTEKVTKFGLNLCEKDNPEAGLKQILNFMTKITDCNIKELFENLNTKLFRLDLLKHL